MGRHTRRFDALGMSAGVLLCLCLANASHGAEGEVFLKAPSVSTIRVYESATGVRIRPGVTLQNNNGSGTPCEGYSSHTNTFVIGLVGHSGNFTGNAYVLLEKGKQYTIVWGTLGSTYFSAPNVIDPFQPDATFVVLTGSGPFGCFGPHDDYSFHGWPSASYKPTVTISGPTCVPFKQQGTFTANASGGTQPYTYEWRFRQSGQTEWILVGTGQTHTRTVTTDFELEAKVASGPYSGTDLHYVTRGCAP